jgi:hypothetical protein
VNLFQWLTLPALGGLFLWEAVGFTRGRGSRGFRLVRGLVWLAAALAIAYPQITSDLATAVGISRGTDLVLYVFVLAFLGMTFYFYARCLRLQRDLTQVVRHLAVREARRGDGAP